LSGPTACGVEVGATVSVKVGLAVGITGTIVLVLVTEVGVVIFMIVEVVVMLVCLAGEALATWHDAKIKEIPMKQRYEN